MAWTVDGWRAPMADAVMADRLNQQIVLEGGRRLGYAEFGDSQGQPLVYCHGFPASRLEGRLFESAALRNHWRMIVLDRPGYGLSDNTAGGCVADWPADVVQLADRLGWARFAVLGVSGGGPYALACAWKIPARVTAVGIVCGLGPVYKAWARNLMKWPGRLGFYLARRARWLLPVVYGPITARIMRWRPEICQFMLSISAPDSDCEVLRRPDIQGLLFAALSEGLRQGAGGALGDFTRYAHYWGFRHEDIPLPVRLWHGDADATVPPYHARRQTDALPRASLRSFPGEGHFSLPVNRMNEILFELSQMSDEDRSVVS